MSMKDGHHRMNHKGGILCTWTLGIGPFPTGKKLDALGATTNRIGIPVGSATMFTCQSIPLQSSTLPTEVQHLAILAE